MTLLNFTSHWHELLSVFIFLAHCPYFHLHDFKISSVDSQLIYGLRLIFCFVLLRLWGVKWKVDSFKPGQLLLVISKLLLANTYSKFFKDFFFNTPKFRLFQGCQVFVDVRVYVFLHLDKVVECLLYIVFSADCFMCLIISAICRWCGRAAFIAAKYRWCGRAAYIIIHQLV